jgi:hypothetical protein
VPAETRAFHPHRKLTHPRKCSELAEIRVRFRVVPGQHAVHAAEEIGDLRAVLALDGFAHQRCRSLRDRAARALKAQVVDDVIFHLNKHM